MESQQSFDRHWNELVGLIRQTWNQLSEDELRGAMGSFQPLMELIQQRTGEARERVESRFMEWIAQGQQAAQQAAAQTADSVEQAGQTLDANYDRLMEGVRQGARQAADLARQRPVEAAVVAFGAGLVAGVVVGALLRSR
ncbi:MAG: hypothetical protein U0795_09060 [Pirellulales bacterium]